TTVGISLMYPLLDFRHGVEARLISPGDQYAAPVRNWEVYFLLDSDLLPGQSRTYTLAVRMTPNSNEWVRTFTPYRSYFLGLYGGLQYFGDPFPVSGATVAAPSCQTASDPRGFCDPARPDLSG